MPHDERLIVAVTLEVANRNDAHSVTLVDVVLDAARVVHRKWVHKCCNRKVITCLIICHNLLFVTFFKDNMNMQVVPSSSISRSVS